jgi:GNAT superfamily N-acetyltransferase
LRFEVGCDLEELREYWNRSGYDENLGYVLNVVIKDPSQLIVWRENDEIVGHAVWHESNTEEHRKGDPRDREERESLERLLGSKKDFVELHAIWLIKKYRGKGYGEMFHTFFEKFMKDKGYSDIVFCAHHPAAVAICHRHGYKEGGCLAGQKAYVFYLSLKKNP